jgi:hypothetical protein
LRFATSGANSLSYETGHLDGPFGPCLAVTLPRAIWPELPASGSHDDGLWWLPPAFIPTALQHGVDGLAEAASGDDRCAARFAQLAAARARRALWRFGHLLGPPDLVSGPAVSQGNVVQWVSMLGEGRAVLVQLMARLSPGDLPLAEDPAAVTISRRARGSTQPVEVPMPTGVLTLDPRTEIVPLVVIATPGHVVAPQAPGTAAMSLDDLTWAAETADAQSDLFMFCRELASPDRPHIFGWEAINLWETWRRDGKSFYHGAAALGGILIEPHQGDAEWWRASEWGPLERALLATGLPPASAFNGVEQTRSATMRLDAWDESPRHDTETWRHPRPGYATWYVYLGGIPAAARVDGSAGPEDHARFLRGVASSLAGGLDHARAAWEAAHDGAEVTGYKIGIEAAPNVAPALSVKEVAAFAGGAVEATLLVNVEALADAAAVDIRAVPKALADAMSDIARRVGIADEAIGPLRDAWMRDGPSIAVAQAGALATPAELTPPVELDAAFASEVSREIAMRVHATGAQAGTYTGDAAKALDNDVLAPAALGLLTERLARYDADELIRAGMWQAERTAAARFSEVGSHRQTARLSPDWDVAARIADIRSEHIALRRCIEVLVELALRDQPAGCEPLDGVAWFGLLAAAHAYLEATSRSEAVHHQVRPTAIEISDLYEIEAVADTAAAATPSGAAGARVYNLDTDELRWAIADYDMDDAGAPGSAPAALDTTGAAGIPGDVDEAVKAAFGASGSDIVNVLLTLADWALSESGADPVITDPGTIIQVLSGLLSAADEPDGARRMRSAVSLLTSRSEQLRAADWRPWQTRHRRHRLLTQPLAALRDDSIVIAPRYCLLTATVYANYLSQGMLPWSAPPPPPLNQALAEWRDKRNRQLENDVAAALRAAGYMCETRIRETDPQRLGVPSLTGEVDAVAGRAGSPVIWLIEVKDPADVSAVPEIRRHLDRFYLSRKKDKAYADQLNAKYRDLSPHADAVAEALRLPAATKRAYEIRPVFVTRRPVPAAFVNGPFPFATLRNLTSKLTAQERTGI